MMKTQNSNLKSIVATSEGVTPQSLSGRTAQGIYGWLPVAVATLALTALTLPAAQAGVEFVTSTANCTKVDLIGDGKDLFIMAGNNVRLRVFGNSVNLSDPTSGFRIATDSGAGAVTARIVSQGTDCGGTGFALVEVDSSAGLTSDIQRSLFFKMPLGDESRLQMKIKAFPAINATWDFQQSVQCTVKTGSLATLNQDKKIRLTLPAGHQQDQTTCNSRTLVANVRPADIGEVDIFRAFNYSVAGLPPFMTSSQANPLGPHQPTRISFPINVAGIRDLDAVSNSTITFSIVPTRTSTLNLEVVPNLANGFTQAANCRNVQTGDTVNVDDLVQCELNLAFQPPAAGQLITFEVKDRLCVEAGALNVEYFKADGIGTMTLRGAGTVFQIPLRALAGTTSATTPCASLTGVQHTVDFWIGVKDTPVPDTQDTFRIRSLQ